MRGRGVVADCVGGVGAARGWWAACCAPGAAGGTRRRRVGPSDEGAKPHRARKATCRSRRVGRKGMNGPREGVCAKGRGRGGRRRRYALLAWGWIWGGRRSADGRNQGSLDDSMGRVPGDRQRQELVPQLRGLAGAVVVAREIAVVQGAARVCGEILTRRHADERPGVPILKVLVEARGTEEHEVHASYP